MAKISTEPWSNYSASDYSLEQWKNACLIVPGGEVTSKSQCKLPVKTPSGVVNRSGVMAAAAALAGARGGVDATPTQKAAARKKLISLYSQIGREVPDSLKHADYVGEFLAHHGVKGQKWGVRRDERALSYKDKALNISQRSQVKVASAVSALTAVGISTNAAATAFQLQARWEHLKIANAVMQQASNNPFLSKASREALTQTRSNIIHGLVGSALATTAISSAIGIVTHRTAKAYFAPLHKVYGDSKGKINKDLRQLRDDIKTGKRSSMTTKQYNNEVAKIVQKHMMETKPVMIQPFHQLAQSQLGLNYGTNKLRVTMSPLPNTKLYSKMTVTTPNGLKLVKAIKNIEHADDTVDLEPVDYYFDYEFDPEGYIIGFSCPTIEIANDLINGTFDLNKTISEFGEGGTMGSDASLTQSDVLDHFLAHHGVKGMKWGVRRKTGSYSPDDFPELIEEPTKTQHVAARKFLASDSNPTNVSHPVHSGDESFHSGETSAGHKSVSYQAGSVGKKIYYTKYDTGEKTYSLDDLSHEINLNSKGEMTTSLQAFSKKGLKHSSTQGGDMADDETQTTAVLVALPRKLDPVRLVGDEDKHVTLLYFGETSSLPQDAKDEILKALNQAATIFAPFSESIRNLQRLGSDVPPAFVAMLSNSCLENIRNTMLMNPAVKGYLSNTTQYPSYTPHLTLGYPDYQGEDPLRKLASVLYRVQFDRLALWWNGEQTEISLGSDMDSVESDDAMAMSDELENFLAHHGVKGMKWGVRRDNSYDGGTYVQGTQGRGSVKNVSIGSAPGDHVSSVAKGTALNLLGFIGSAYAAPLAARYADVYPVIRLRGKALNEKYSQPGKNLATNKSLQNAYDKEYQKMIVDSFKGTTVKGLVLPSASSKIAVKRLGNMNELKFDFHMKPGRKTDKARLTITRPNGKTQEFKLGKFTAPKVKHSDSDEVSYDLEVNLTRDSNGYITNLSIPELESLNHSTDSIDNFLAHHGIKGMKWGVRRDLSTAATGSLVKTSDLGRGDRKALAKASAGDTVTVKGSHGSSVHLTKGADGRVRVARDPNAPSKDARRAAYLASKKPQELSDAELREVLNRADQVRRFNQLLLPEGNSPTAQSPLEAKVKEMQLQKQYKDLNTALNPPKEAAIKKLVKSTQSGFKAYKAVDKLTGGLITKKITTQLGLQPAKSSLDKLKEENSYLKELDKNVTTKKKIDDFYGLYPQYYTGATAGKHRNGSTFPVPKHRKTP